MIIGKIINNNVISSWDQDGSEIIIMGRGLGFQKKTGQEVAEDGIEKIFRLESKDVRERFKDLLASMPLEYIQVSADIISYARKNLNTKLSQNVYLTLTDHIGFAIERFKDGMDFSNALYREIKRFYPQEFEIGMHALLLIEERTGIRLPDDEAASIAIHLVDAEFDIKVRDTWAMTNMIQSMMELLENNLKLPPEDSLYRDRLASNLKFLAHRMLLLPPAEGREDIVFSNFVKNHCAGDYALAEKVKKHVKEQYGCDMTGEEQIYLALQLKQAGGFTDTIQTKGKQES